MYVVNTTNILITKDVLPEYHRIPTENDDNVYLELFLQPIDQQTDFID